MFRRNSLLRSTQRRCPLTTLDLTTFTTLPTLAHDSLTTFDFTTVRPTTLDRRREADRRARTEGRGQKRQRRNRPDWARPPPDPLTRCSRSRRTENRATGRQADSLNNRRDSRRQPRPLGRINSRRNAACARLHRLGGRIKRLQITAYAIKARRTHLRAFSCR